MVAAVNGTGWLFRDYDPYTGLGCGEYIVIDDPGGHKSRYCHLKDRIVGDGQQVARGQVLGHEGTTGATAVHLHFDTREGGTSGNCCDGTSVDPYGGTYSPGTWMWEDQPPGGQPPNHADFSPSIASWVSTRVDIFARGENNHLYQRTRTGSWGGWSQPFNGATCLRSAPAAVTWSTSRLEVFYRGCDNAIWRNYWTGSGWYSQSLGGCTLGAPGAASWGANRIDVFYRDCSNVLRWTSTTNGGGSWSAHNPIAGTCLRSGPAAVSRASGYIDVVYRGCSDQIVHHWYTGGWPAESFGGCTMVAPAIASWGSNRLDVFHRGCGPADYEGTFQKSWNGSSWTAWTDISAGDCLASGPGSDAWAPDKLDVPYRGCGSPDNAFVAYSANGVSWIQASFDLWP